GLVSSTAAGGEFPFGFGRQALSQRLAVSNGGIPTNIHHGVIGFTFRKVVAIPIFQIVAVMKSFRNSCGVPLRICANEFLELRVRYFILVQIKRIDGDSVLWRFRLNEVGML